MYHVANIHMYVPHHHKAGVVVDEYLNDLEWKRRRRNEMKSRVQKNKYICTYLHKISWPSIYIGDSLNVENRLFTIR